MAFGLAVTDGREVGVFDFAKGVVVRWGLRGELLPALTFPSGVGAWHGLAIRGDTVFLPREVVDSVRSLFRLTLVIGDSISDIDAILGPPRPIREFGCFAAPMAPVFAPQPVWSAGAGLLGVAGESRYVIRLYRAGKLVRIIRRDLPAVRTNRSTVDRLYPRGMAIALAGGERCTVPTAEVVAKAGMATTLPAIGALAFGIDGTLWVERYRLPGAERLVDVFDSASAYLGTTNGLGVPLGWLGRDRVLFAVSDSSTGARVIAVHRVAGR